MQDLIIIGAGPTGIYAGFQAGLRKISATILEALPLTGGLLTTFYPDKPVYDIPGFISIQADQFIQHLISQWQPYQSAVPLKLDQQVVGLTPIEGGYAVTTQTQTTYQAKYVLFATGTGNLKPRLLPFQDQGYAHRVHYAITDLKTFQNQRVVVLGGGDSALDWANTLTGIAKQVTIVHRRHEFRGFASSLSTFKTKGKVLTAYEVKNIVSLNQGVRLDLLNLETEIEAKMEADHIVVCYGFMSTLGTYTKLGLHAQADGIHVDQRGQTNLSHVYAVGNAAIYQGKSKTIATALGEVASVMETINSQLHPGQKILYSSQLK
jgi:thioredoxin reductase (NADPH)